jgi:hypothetical protein
MWGHGRKTDPVVRVAAVPTPPLHNAHDYASPPPAARLLRAPGHYDPVQSQLVSGCTLPRPSDSATYGPDALLQKPAPSVVLVQYFWLLLVRSFWFRLHRNRVPARHHFTSATCESTQAGLANAITGFVG